MHLHLHVKSEKESILRVIHSTMDESGQMFATPDPKLLRFREMEREQIAINRYYLGQQLGHYVTWEHSEFDWIWCHRKGWLAMLKASGEYPYD